MKKILSVLLVLALVITVAGCASVNTRNQQPEITPTPTPTPTSSPEAPSASSPASSATVTDSRGVQLTFDKIPEKIVSLMPSDTEILYAMGLGSKIIAVSEYCNYPEDTANKQKLPTGEKMNVETLVGLRPDVVFLGKMSITDDQTKQLEQAGIKVVVTEANTIEETYKVIEMIGTAVGREGEAADLVDGMKKGFDDIKASVAGKTPVSVYIEVSPLQYGLWSAGKNTFIQELIDLIGAKNVFSDIEGWAAVSEEQVLQRNPQIILTTASPLTGIQDPVGEITSRANWDKLDAVKNNKVIMLDGDMLSRPGPRLLNAAMELVKAVYQ